VSRKNKNFRAWQHRNPNGTPKEAWDAAWKSQGSKAYSLRIQALQDEIKDLQMADPHLEFISRVQDAGLHEDWNDFCDMLAAQESLAKLES
jgi:hypothetical protein